MRFTTITRNGKRFVLVPAEEFKMLSQQSLPPLPMADAEGTCNAIDFARASIARRLIRDRRGIGLSQQELAKLADVRQETISRIESGKHTATTRIIDKLDRAIHHELKRKRRKSA